MIMVYRRTEPASPIRRHPSIVPFSRDHHFGLLLSWKIRQGIKNHIDGERISDYVIYFFEKALAPHFRLEEEQLFPLFAEGHAGCQQALREHTQLEFLVNELRRDKTGKVILQAFADLLEKHIRFEERILFNQLQTEIYDPHLTEDRSQHLTKEDDPDLNWEDHFWTASPEKRRRNK